MTLGELIIYLEGVDPNFRVPLGFNNPHSYRGDYSDLAFEPREEITAEEMLAAARSALGRTFTGYKGGEYEMKEYTSVWIANYGESVDSETIGPILLNYMFGKLTPAQD